ncbi:MAG: MBL fold metallo-hydrolase [Lachnospiraceae bacterium]|nr:MBL fold metallo-hydrolase [Lachnospiraceae bacterium]
MIRIKACPVGLLQANCYLAWNPETRKGFLVDPGDRADVLQEFIQKNDVIPEAILLTHGHFDHIGAARELKEAWKIPVFAGEKEAVVLQDSFLNLSGRYTRHPFGMKADRLLSDGEEFSLAGYRIRVLHTPGHTEGGLCYELPEERILFSGDTLFEASYGRTDGPDGDYEEMMRSLGRLLRELPEDTLVLSGHGPETSIAQEREQNPAVFDLLERQYL